MAKYMSRRHGLVDLKTHKVHAFSNESYKGIEIEWASQQLGFGSCTLLLFAGGDEGNTKIMLDANIIEQLEKILVEDGFTVDREDIHDCGHFIASRVVVRWK